MASRTRSERCCSSIISRYCTRISLFPTSLRPSNPSSHPPCSTHRSRIKRPLAQQSCVPERSPFVLGQAGPERRVAVLRGGLCPPLRALAHLPRRLGSKRQRFNRCSDATHGCQPPSKFRQLHSGHVLQTCDVRGAGESGKAGKRERGST
eukprot:3818043-Rhodomonas_salina.2